MKPNNRLPESDAEEILKRGKYGVLSTISPDGTPYGVPLNYFYAPEDSALYFHGAVNGRKIENITANGNVSFVVIGSEQIAEEQLTTRYESVIVTGIASLITDDKEKRDKLGQLCEILAPAGAERTKKILSGPLPPVAIVKITIHEITGKKH